MEDYVADKRLIYADQTKGDYAIFDDEGDEAGTEPDREKHPGCSSWGDLFSSEAKATVLRYGRGELTSAVKGNAVYGVWQEEGNDGNIIGKVLLPNMDKPEVIMKGLSVPGEHMKTNVLNAALVMYLMGVPAERCAKICSQWQGIDHRLQYFHTWEGPDGTKYKFYNDSCATVPEAAAAASQSFGKSVILMTGGTDKGLDLAPLARILTEPDTSRGEFPVKELYLLAGSATDKLLPALDKSGVKYHGPFNSLEELLQDAKANAQKKSQEEVFVFSPGATSFGMFQNEFDRGNKYMAAVKALFIPKS